MSWLYSTCFKIAWLICGSWLKRANCQSRLMATIYFLGPSPRHDFRFYLIARIHFAICVFCSVVSFPQKILFGGPLYLAVRREYKKRTRIKRVRQVDGNDLFSRAVSSQISSTCKSLTFVFGMGTSGTS